MILHDFNIYDDSDNKIITESAVIAVPRFSYLGHERKEYNIINNIVIIMNNISSFRYNSGRNIFSRALASTNVVIQQHVN